MLIRRGLSHEPKTKGVRKRGDPPRRTTPPSLSALAWRSGCSSAEPYPPARQTTLDYETHQGEFFTVRANQQFHVRDGQATFTVSYARHQERLQEFRGAWQLGLVKSSK